MSYWGITESGFDGKMRLTRVKIGKIDVHTLDFDPESGLREADVDDVAGLIVAGEEVMLLIQGPKGFEPGPKVRRRLEGANESIELDVEDGYNGPTLWTLPRFKG